MIKKSYQYNRGMTYVELIVVLSIFSILSAVAIFNYGDFQSKVDLRNLSSDIALKIVEAQKSALSGELASGMIVGKSWKPSYGVYFDLAVDNKSFLYFVDLDNGTDFTGTDCTGECLNKVSITRDSIISGIEVFYQNGPVTQLNDLTITFTRPNSGAVINSSIPFNKPFSYVQIRILAKNGATSLIKIYPSGRLQLN